MPLMEITMFPQSADLKERLTNKTAEVVNQESKIPKELIWIIIRDIYRELVGWRTCCKRITNQKITMKEV